MITLSEVSNYLISIQVANFAALPPAATNANKMYYCVASQGTPYWTALWGGTYYPSGWYRSNGVTWEYQTTAYQASLADVIAGTIQDQFVSPYTLKQGPNLDQSGAKNYAVASGTDTYTATIAPAITAYAAGQMFHLNFTNANTGASTINLNSLGAKNIVDSAGSAVSAGTLSGVVSVIYNGTNFQVLSGNASSSGLKKSQTIYFTHSTLNPADGLNYFFAVPGSTAATSTGVLRRKFAMLTGYIYEIVCHISISTTLGTTEQSTVKLNNKTAGTSVTITAVAQYDAVGQTYTLTLGSPFAITKWDSLEIEVNMPTFATNPVGVIHYVEALAMES